MFGLSDPLFFIFLFTFLITFSYKYINKSLINEKKFIHAHLNYCLHTVSVCSSHVLLDVSH